MLFVRREKIPQVWSLMASEERNKADIRKFEEIGTHPSANALAINEALDFYEGIGAERKAARLRYLFHRWAKRLEVNPRVRIHTSYDPEQSCGLTLFDVEGIDLSKLAIHLEQNHRIITTLIIHDEFRGSASPPMSTPPFARSTFLRKRLREYIEKQGKAS
jgi:selenocysteine lyase/cysteine desulfurase